MNWGGVGIWIGLAVGLAVNATVLLTRFHWMTRHPPERILPTAHRARH